MLEWPCTDSSVASVTASTFLPGDAGTTEARCIIEVRGCWFAFNEIRTCINTNSRCLSMMPVSVRSSVYVALDVFVIARSGCLGYSPSVLIRIC